MHTHTHTKEGKGEGSTPHSPFRTRPTTHSFPIATFKIGVSYCEMRNVLKGDRQVLRLPGGFWNISLPPKLRVWRKNYVSKCCGC